MIAKRIDMRDAAKSRATRLAKYVTDELERAGRVAGVFTVNCISDDALLAAKEIEICQARNTRTREDKTYHLLLSFPDGERPDGDRLREIAAAAAKALGYGEHQRIAVVHDDTDNLHMHLIINKIHPVRHTIHTPRRDFKILGEVCVNLERDYALTPTNHEPGKNAAGVKARDMEAHSGAESFVSYAKEKATPLLAAAQSWDALHHGLAEAGIFLRLRGNGLVMVDQTGAVAVKASAVGRDFAKGKLEKRFGAFVPHDASRTPLQSPMQSTGKPESTYRKDPLAGTSQLYQQYLTEKETAWKDQKAQLAAVWDEQKQIMRRIAASEKLDLPRAVPYHRKRLLRLQARNSANAAIADVRRSMGKRRSEIKARHKPLGYIEWLKREAERGNIPAIYALRRRGSVAPAVINITARDLRSVTVIASKISHVTGRGTLFYRTGEDIFRDNGNHLSLKKDITEQGVKAALMIAMTKFNGQPLAVNGSDELKAHCINVAAKAGLDLSFADPDMERERQKRVLPDSSRDAPSRTAPERQETMKEQTHNRSHSIPREQQRRGMTR